MVNSEACVRGQPFDVLQNILCSLNDGGWAAMSGTCRCLREAEQGFAKGEYARPLRLTVDLARTDQHPASLKMDPSSGKIAKTTRPGRGVAICNERLDLHTSFWEVQIDRFQGRNIEIGVCTRDAVADGGLDRSLSWFIDGTGRVHHNGKVHAYGQRLSPGDVVGVLLDTGSGTLSFFLNGTCMGPALQNVAASGRGLYPLVTLPCCSGDEVTLVARPASVHLPMRVDALTRKPCAGAVGMAAAATASPNKATISRASDLTVLQASGRNSYRVPGVHVAACTVGQLREQLAAVIDKAQHYALPVDPSSVLLVSQGVLLRDPQMPLVEAGICVGPNGVQMHDILMHPPICN